MEHSSFFNAKLSDDGTPDRVYTAENYASYFSSFIGNGVFPNPSTNLQVCSNEDMFIKVSPGKAWINGYMYYNDSDLILKIDPADGVLKRIDRIVLRLDFLNREITSIVKKGVFGSSPATSPSKTFFIVSNHVLNSLPHWVVALSTQPSTSLPLSSI